MQRRYRVLLAAQSEALKVLEPILDPFGEIIAVHTTADAFHALDRGGIDVIVCTIAFDDSRMIDFLQAVKRTLNFGSIPFVCVRALQSVLTDQAVENCRKVSLQCGAAVFLDIAKLGKDEAAKAFATSLKR